MQKIIDGARDTSKIVNLEFRKYSSKPEMQMVYIDSDKMQKKLQQMGTRLDSNKYQMVTFILNVDCWSEERPNYGRTRNEERSGQRWNIKEKL